MKTNYFLLMLFIITTSSVSFAQWTVNTSLAGQYYLLDAVHFIDNNVGFIGGIAPTIGDSSKIKKTTNGGTTWTDVATVKSGVRDITFINANLGFAVGDGGLIAKTTNGGNTWSTQYYINPNTSTLEALESVYFVDQNIGYIAGGFYEMWVLKTTDGGANWTPLTMPTYFQRLKSIYFTSATTGYVVGGDASGGGIGRIYKTINGGSTWDTLSSGIASNYFIDINFSDANNGVISCVNSGIILRTTNAGTTWTQVTNPAGTDQITEFSFANSTVGYASTLLGKVIKTTNGGSTWTIDGTLSPMSAAYAISIPNINFGIVGGLYGMFGKMDTSIGIDDFTNDNKLLIYPNPGNGNFNIDFNGSASSLEVYDVMGKNVFSKNNITNKTAIDLSSQPKGIYFVKITIDNKNYNKKIICQ